MLVLHYTDTKDAAEALAILTDPAAKVSSHYLVDADGTTHALVDEASRAWHAGVSCWRGQNNINHRSIGIEIVNPGHRYGLQPFPKAQMEAVAELCTGILARHAIAARNVVAHSDIAPARKLDPGELFDWQFLASRGIGLWPVAGKSGAGQEQLAQFGYCALPDVPMEKLIAAFQRRFRPKTISGQWDSECGALLASLLSML